MNWGAFLLILGIGQILLSLALIPGGHYADGGEKLRSSLLFTAGVFLVAIAVGMMT